MNAIIELIRELLIRLKLKSPALFVKLQWVSGLLVTIITSLLIINSTFGWGWGLILIFKIPLTIILGSIITFLSGIFITAKTTVDDKKELNGKLF